MPIKHDAFISYSHGSDLDIAGAFARALERFGKPLLGKRPRDVFLDRTSLAPSASLQDSIERHLQGSDWFLLMASRQSAQSVWCREEIEWWLNNAAVERMLILHSDGEIVWDRSRNDFDWSRTSALAQALTG